MAETATTTSSRAGSSAPSGGLVSAQASLDRAAAVARLEAALLERPGPLPELPPYRVLRSLGAGGMGIVYEAYDPRLNRRVALKVLRRSLATESEHRLLTEAQAIARITHPNVVRVFDVGRHHDVLFFVMELIEGETLAKWSRASDRSMTELLAVFADAARGLAAAHDHGIVHADFKPGNVLVDATGTARVLDFGLAYSTVPDSTLASDPSETTALETPFVPVERSGIVGTPAYMAPEQWNGAKPTIASDGFAFFRSLLEVLSGTKPRPAVFLTRQDIAKVVPSGTPSGVRELVIAGLDRRPSRRVSDMHRIAEVLDAAARRRPARRKHLVFIGALALAGLFGPTSEGPDVDAACHRPLIPWSAAASLAARDGSLVDLEPMRTTFERQYAETRSSACSAEPARLASRLGCLEDAKRNFELAVETLESAGISTAQRGRSVLGNVSSPDSCLDDEGVNAGRLSPRSATELVLGHIARDEGRADEAWARATRAYRYAVTDRDARTEVETRLTRGKLAGLDGRHDDARSELEQARVVAVRHGFDGLARRAALRLALWAAWRGDSEATSYWYRHAGLAPDVPVSQAPALALEARLWQALHDGDPREADSLVSELEARAARGDVSGQGVISMLEAKAELQSLRGDSDALVDTRRDVLARIAELHGADSPQAAGGLLNLANALSDAGRREEAMEALDRAVSIHRHRGTGAPLLVGAVVTRTMEHVAEDPQERAADGVAELDRLRALVATIPLRDPVRTVYEVNRITLLPWAEDSPRAIADGVALLNDLEREHLFPEYRGHLHRVLAKVLFGTGRFGEAEFHATHGLAPELRRHAQPTEIDQMRRIIDDVRRRRGAPEEGEASRTDVRASRVGDAGTR
jgi:eukaryotic-like serine/threonine-protein kinase